MNPENHFLILDYKLVRRIMSDAVKQIENTETFDQKKTAHAYLVLGETEENLEKFVRAIKYYKRGALHSTINKTDEAIDYLEKTIELAVEENNSEIEINSLVSIAKMYGSKKEYEKAYNYFDQSQLDEAILYYEKGIAIHLRLPNYSARKLGMIYMQYAYCVERKEQSDKLLAGRSYEKSIEPLEKKPIH